MKERKIRQKEKFKDERYCKEEKVTTKDTVQMEMKGRKILQKGKGNYERYWTEGN